MFPNTNEWSKKLMKQDMVGHVDNRPSIDYLSLENCVEVKAQQR